MPTPYEALPRNNAGSAEVQAAYKKSNNGRQVERLLMVLLSLSGKTAPTIATLINRGFAKNQTTPHPNPLPPRPPSPQPSPSWRGRR